MKNLIKAELFLLFKSLCFKILLFFSFFMGGLICITDIMDITIIISGVTNERTVGIDEIIAYQQMTFFNMVFGGILASVFICSGFKRRTYGISLLSGNTRLKIFLAKFIVLSAGMFLLSIAMAAVPFVVVLVNGTINSSGNGAGYVLMRLIYALTGFMAQCSVIIFIAVTVKSGALTNIISISFTYILLVIKANMRFYKEPAIEPYVKYIYLYQAEMFRLCEDGFSDVIYLVVMVLTSIISLFLSAMVFNKSELK
ncbi:MAG: hypothetical protein OSJ45_12340 [Lachnospiraceae bacterium]|nr:hypothetical protein [Lachnospiraceae bacterium]